MKRALNNKKGAVLKVDKLYIDGTLYEAATEVDSDDEDDTGETGTQIEGGDEEEGYGHVESDLIKIISWNINGGISSKFNDSSFRCFILSYDIILLTECRIEKKISLDVEGFCCFFPRKLSNQNRIVDVKF